ncbi:MAG: NADH-quinone oxidoreductase subunit L [Anaerolineales bacterium]|nr:NADH-quinone oxidoreductase subunit L [Anaerolineales bacterium]
MFQLAPLLVLIPIAGLLVNIVIGNRVSEKVAGWIGTIATALTFIVAVILAGSLMAEPGTKVVPFAPWIHIGDLELNWAFQIDTLSVVMMLVVAGVGTLIHVYAIGYMHYDVRYKGDPRRFKRFFVYLNLFIAAMMVLVSADNYGMLFVGWEGVGLCSFLLISFWLGKNPDGTDDTGNMNAGKKAFIVNRVGDFGLLIGIFLMFWFFGSLTFEEVFHHVEEVPSWVVLAITLFFLLGVTGKSAQLPLYVWLPDAMAGPTPVSALIHAATMVTAGVYLITRSAPLYDAAPQAQAIVAIVGGLTAFFAATIAVAQSDIKKVLAYSTISQLGFMVAAAGMGAYVAAIFHLVAHAFFKALLFLGAGSVIIGLERAHHPLPEDGGESHEHGHHDGDAHHDEDGEHDEGEHVFDPNDMWNMGGIRHTMPVTFWVYLIGSLALAGIPPFAGFFSKDEILTELNELNTLAYVLLTLAAFFTAFYVGRQLFIVFAGKPRSEAAKKALESPLLMTVPLMLLAVLTVLGGSINFPGIHPLTDFLEATLEHIHVVDFSLRVAAISTVLAVIGLILGWVVYGRRPLEAGQPDPLRRWLGPIYRVLENKYWVDELYGFVFGRPYAAASKFLADVIDWRFLHDWLHNNVVAAGYQRFSDFLANAFDLGVIDGIANGIADGTKAVAARTRVIQTGFVRNYALAVFIGVVIIVSYLVLR